jgi:hypothetical protein
VVVFLAAAWLFLSSCASRISYAFDSEIECVSSISLGVNGMTQILTIRYTKKEEKLAMIANSLGVLVSIPPTSLIGYALGLFSDLKVAAFSSVRWAILMLEMGSIMFPIGWLATTAICFRLFRTGKNAMPNRKMILSTLILPLTLMYAFVVCGLVIFPLVFLMLDYINRPLTGLIVGLLAMLPFCILWGGVLLPESRAGKALRRLNRRSGNNQKALKID